MRVTKIPTHYVLPRLPAKKPKRKDRVTEWVFPWRYFTPEQMRKRPGDYRDTQRGIRGPEAAFPWFRPHPNTGKPYRCWLAVIERYRLEGPWRRGPSNGGVPIRKILEEAGVPNVESVMRSRYFFRILRRFERYEADKAFMSRWEDCKEVRE